MKNIMICSTAELQGSLGLQPDIDIIQCHHGCMGSCLATDVHRDVHPQFKRNKNLTYILDRQGCPRIDPQITRIQTVMTRAYTDHSWQVTCFPWVTHCG